MADADQTPGNVRADETDEGDTAADGDTAGRQDDSRHKVEKAAAVEVEAQADSRFIG